MALAVAAPAQSASPAILSLDRATSSRASHVSHISQVATARAFPRDARLAAHLDAFALASAARPSARQDSHKHRAWRLRTRGRTGDDATLSSSSDDVPKEAKERAAAQEKARSLVGDLKGTSIFLVGMMGSGKTTVGTLLADLLGYCFFDSDRVVEAAAGGASVAQIFAENGEEEFREIETRVLAELSSMGRLVVATGGGAVTRPVNWSYLSHGVTVHLDVPVEHLAERVVAVGTAVRPLLSQPTQGEGEGGKQQAADESDEYGKTLTRLAGLLGERKSLYSNADTTISLQEVAMRSASQVHEVTPTRIALEILERLEQMVAERQARDAALRAKAA
ncbi:unnamed protein product [Closterium sp. NIES-64]|nr:unnamed protein product [Closterium sp. NIES-64]CAI5941461.1 unnamed protein product [Closterium sp. NIES-65]CAI5954487.1 unnamed protein product [Closterium sp. NIES-64]